MHPANSPEIKINDPRGIIDTLAPPTRTEQLIENPIYRSTIGKLIHPITAIKEGALIRESKEMSWEASQGRSGLDVTREPGQDRFRHELLPRTFVEHNRALRASKKVTHQSQESMKYFGLQNGAYSIDSQTGRSSWRQPDGSLSHVGWRTKRGIRHDEKKFEKLKGRIDHRAVELLGEDPARPHEPAKTAKERVAEAQKSQLAIMRQSGTASDEVKLQVELTRRAAIAAGEDKINVLASARARSLEQYRQQSVANANSEILNKQRKRGRKIAAIKLAGKTAGSVTAAPFKSIRENYADINANIKERKVKRLRSEIEVHESIRDDDSIQTNENLIKAIDRKRKKANKIAFKAKWARDRAEERRQV